MIQWASVQRVRAFGGELNARLLHAAVSEDGMSTVEYAIGTSVIRGCQGIHAGGASSGV